MEKKQRKIDRCTNLCNCSIEDRTFSQKQIFTSIRLDFVFVLFRPVASSSLSTMKIIVNNVTVFVNYRHLHHRSINLLLQTMFSSSFFSRFLLIVVLFSLCFSHDSTLHLSPTEFHHFLIVVFLLFFSCSTDCLDLKEKLGF